MLATLIFLVHTGLAMAMPNHNIHELKRFTRAIYQPDEECLFDMCELNNNDYPTDFVSSVIEKDNRFAEAFGDVVGPYNVTKFQSRLNIGNDPENFCSVSVRSITPQRAKTVHNKWKTVVNVPGRYQLVNLAFCRNQNAPCLDNDYLPSGYSTSCEQVFIKIRLVTIDEDGNLSQDYFPIPSGCACMRVQQYTL